MAFKKGNIPYCKGKHLTEETRKKISESSKGRVFTEEHKRAISESKKGKKRKPFSEEHKKKLGDSNRGKTTWIKGKHHKEESKKLISQKGKGRIVSLETRKKNSDATKGKNNPMFGTHHTDEWKIKMRKSSGGEWSGKKYSTYDQIRSSFLSRQWRSDVFQRDNYTCIWCGDNKGGNLNADHIKEFNVILREHNITTIEEAEKCEELWNINNGRTLCKSCHIKRHKNNQNER